MDYCNSKTSIYIFLLLSLIIAFAYPALSDELQPVMAPLPQHQTAFQIKKTAPLPILKSRYNKKVRGILYRKKLKREKMAAKNLDARRFSAMLPKGYVPPSGSSPCHNVYPNSVSFFCDYSTQKQKP